MNLTEATYLLRYLSHHRLPGMMASEFAQDEHDGTPTQYHVMVNLTNLQGDLDLSQLGVHTWLMGYRTVLRQGVLTFDKGPKMLDKPMWDPDDPIEADAEDEPADDWARQRREDERRMMETIRLGGFQAGYGDPFGDTRRRG